MDRDFTEEGLREGSQFKNDYRSLDWSYRTVTMRMRSYRRKMETSETWQWLDGGKGQRRWGGWQITAVLHLEMENDPFTELGRARGRGWNLGRGEPGRWRTARWRVRRAVRVGMRVHAGGPSWKHNQKVARAAATVEALWRWAHLTLEKQLWSIVQHHIFLK